MDTIKIRFPLYAIKKSNAIFITKYNSFLENNYIGLWNNYIFIDFIINVYQKHSGCTMYIWIKLPRLRVFAIVSGSTCDFDRFFFLIT